MLQFVSPPDYAPPEPGGEPGLGGPWRGAVERFEPLVGIEGWALRLDAPAEPLDLELTVGGDAFALAVTFEPRPEIEATLGLAAPCGFRFGPETFARLARLSPHRRGLPVGVRIAGTEIALRPSRGRAPSVTELVEEWQSAVLGSLAPPERRLGKGERLSARLSALRAEADGVLQRPLRPLADHDVGQIEAIFPASEGQVWIIGWMRRGVEPDFPAVVVDRLKYPTGMAILPYERQDLPTNAVGIVGLLDTGWTPPLVLKDGFVYLGRQGIFHLRYGAFTRLMRADAFLAAFGQAQNASGAGHADAMAALLHAGSNWLAGNAAATGMAVEGGIDRLLMLPGFGCFAEGWAVSPAKRVESFHMRIGDCVLVADESATCFRPRADLGPVFGTAQSVIGRAGFSAVLRGAIPPESTGAPLLRIVHDDGTSAVQRVEPKVLRRLDPVSDGEELLRLYPSLRHEPFYPAFLASVRRQLAERRREPAILALEAAARVLVMRLPSEPSNLNLAIDRLEANVPDLPMEVGVALVADQGRSRAEAMLRFQDLRGALANPLSLFTLSHEDDALAELPFLLDRLGAERFVYAGRGAVPTRAGWEGIASSLSRRGHGIDRFEIVDDSGLVDRVDGPHSAAFFGWSVPALLEWSTLAPRLTRGLYRGSGLPRRPRGDRAFPGAALRVEHPRASRLADMLDEDLLATGGGLGHES